MRKTMGELAAELCEIKKQYRKKLILKGCSLKVHVNSPVLITGQNGSGKSTLLKILTGLLSPTKGRVRMHSKKIGYYGHESMLYSNLTVFENLKFFSSLTSDQDTLDSAIKTWGLASIQDSTPSGVSEGQRNRISLCRAFHTGKNLLILDEPTTSLDSQGKEKLLQELTTISRERAIIISTHEPEVFTPLNPEYYSLKGGILER